jgi:hypothetical protein
MVAEALFGKGPKDEVLLGKGIYKRYGIAQTGFHISSCQFALHYFFENPMVLHSFIRNVAECTQLQGYFICTSYDGLTLFKLLKNKKEDEGIEFTTEDKYGNKRKICNIIKKYSHDGFSEDETSIGYPIHVFQETIQKTSLEYLVSFKYLVRIMENYGFELIRDNEAQQMGLPHASGLFDELYKQMEQEIANEPHKKPNYKDAWNMSSAEKQISFLNRYCVFRKTTQVSKETMDQFAKLAKQQYNKEERFENAEFAEMLENIESTPSRANIGHPKKLKVRITLRQTQEKSDKELENSVQTLLENQFTQPPPVVKYTGKKIRISKK